MRELYLQVHGMIETGKTGNSDLENKVYKIYTCDWRCMHVKYVQVFQRNYLW